MRRAALIALATLPLLGFDCGGTDPASSGAPTSCTLAIRGAVNEDLWCVVTVFDYSQLSPEFPEFTFELLANRGMMELGAGVGIFLPARAQVGTAYGWDSATGVTNVDSGDATRYVLDADGYPLDTHSAMAPFGDWGSGKLSVRLTTIPPASASGAELLNVHGTLTGTLPSTAGGAAVTISATF